MNLYKAYLDEIEKRKELGLQPKPIEDGLLLKEMILMTSFINQCKQNIKL